MIRRLLHLVPVPCGASVLDISTRPGLLRPFVSDLIGPYGHISSVAPDELARDRYDLILMYSMLTDIDDVVSGIKHLRDNNLNLGGHILIAYPEPRHKINMRRTGSEQNLLPEGQALRRRLNHAGINVNVVVDTDEAYAIVISDR